MRRRAWDGGHEVDLRVSHVVVALLRPTRVAIVAHVGVETADDGVEVTRARSPAPRWRSSVKFATRRRRRSSLRHKDSDRCRSGSPLPANNQAKTGSCPGRMLFAPRSTRCRQGRRPWRSCAPHARALQPFALPRRRAARCRLKGSAYMTASASHKRWWRRRGLP